MTASNLHIYFVLDRSGSMASIASDVIGGFNTFLAEQQADGRDALMTFIQFDSEDPHEMVTAGVPVAEMVELTPATFRPRGGTPLYDAMGHAIVDATIREEQRRSANLAAEEILFVTFTDGEENQSVEYDRTKIFNLVQKRSEKGWSFAFLGANQNAYGESGAIGYSAASTQNFAADAQGTAAAFNSLSGSVVRRRDKIRKGEAYLKADLFEGDKEAEEDLRRRKTS
jgi:Mg-chelatase subunit ChlD